MHACRSTLEDPTGLARALGCAARKVEGHADLLEALDEVLPRLAERNEPLLLEVVITPEETFAP